MRPSAHWLALPLAAGAGCGGPEPDPPPGWFPEVSREHGLEFAHDAGMDGTCYLPEHLASGAAFLDHDGDGDLDVYLVNGAHHAGEPGPAPQNRLFRNDGGRFVDATEESGLGDAGYGMALAVGDYDNDGDVDVYVANFGPDVLYRNEGGGTFRDVTAEAGIDNPRWACAASFFDYDLDGRLDLYVGNYLQYDDPVRCKDSAGRPEYCGPKSRPPEVDVLYHNEGDGRFADASVESGIAGARGHTLGVLCEDLDEDTWPDVLVANDADPNFLWRNRGDGTFEELGAQSGVALNAYGKPEASMGVAAGDPDGDGDLDLLVTHLSTETNTYYRCDGPALFRDATVSTGLGPPSLERTGFGVAFLDWDHDGLLDVAVANGRVRRGPLAAGVDPAAPLAAYREPNLLFRNAGGARFEDLSDSAGAAWTTPTVSRSLACGDFDEDGDLDLLVADCDGRARLFRNDAPKRGHWLAVRALDPALARDAHGARVVVRAGERTFLRTVNPATGYAASHDPRAHFGLGAVEHVDAIEVEWPGGQRELFPGGAVDRVVVLQRGGGR